VFLGFTVLVRARQLGIETIGEIELAWRHLQSSHGWLSPAQTETTTTALIAAIFKTAGLHAACGNIGYAACDLAVEALGKSPTPRLATHRLGDCRN